MGQSTSQPQAPIELPPSHPSTNLASSSNASPPPGCPMHQKTAGPAATPPPAPHATPSNAKCPVVHDESAPINPHNNMPAHLSSQPAAHQTLALPTDRAVSSIPRADTAADAGGARNWEYPSPQQFYNALVRKGWETPEEHVETMVEIHNFLNEEAWNEVRKWERRWNPTMSEEPELARLQGKPGQLSPKARIHLFAGWLFPSKFNSEPPFDRHDWVIRRPSTGEEVRYVIDYYSAPDDAEGNPVFSLDVRPALDNVGSIKQRIAVATEEAWGAFRNGEL